MKILIFILIVGLFFYLIYINRTKKADKQIIGRQKTVFKNKGIKNYIIVGVKYYCNDINMDPNIYGYVKTENNKHDKYAVCIYNHDNSKIGYVPKGNFRLNNSLNEWHDGKLISWGQVWFDNYSKNWHGNIYIPLTFNESDISDLKIIFDLLIKRRDYLNNKIINNNQYIELLDDELLITKILHENKEINISEGINFHLSKKILPAFCKKLEDEKDWETIIKLEKYKEIIDLLSDRYKNSIYNKIELAKKKLKV